jgi:DNA polymerase III delta prime subunit
MLVVLGACLAGLVALAILPAIWRRAVRLTRQAVEATSPMTHTDVRAEISSLRASHALEQRRLESGLERLQAETASNRIARDRAESAANDLRKEMLSRDQALAEAAAREDGLRREIQEREEAVAMARARQRELERSLKRMMASAGDSAAAAVGAPQESAEAASSWQADSDASVARASDLARIAGLESEITSLKRKLEAAEQKARETAGAGPAEGSPAPQAETNRRRFGQQNNRLFEVESKLIAAQAEITRLSILLEEAGQSGSTDAKELTADSAQGLARLTADAERLEAENARLRAELHSNDAFMSMRRELSDLAASVMASLEGEADTATTEKGPAAPGSAKTAPVQDAGKNDAPADAHPGKDTQSSLSARIRAARKRLKADNGRGAAPETAARETPASKEKAGV